MTMELNELTGKSTSSIDIEWLLAALTGGEGLCAVLGTPDDPFSLANIEAAKRAAKPDDEDEDEDEEGEDDETDEDEEEEEDEEDAEDEEDLDEDEDDDLDDDEDEDEDED